MELLHDGSRVRPSVRESVRLSVSVHLSAVRSNPGVTVVFVNNSGDPISRPTDQTVSARGPTQSFFQTLRRIAALFRVHIPSRSASFMSAFILA